MRTLRVPMIAMLMWSGLVCAVGAEDGNPVPRYDRATLEAVSRDVLRHGARDGARTGPTVTSPRANGVDELTADDSPPDPIPPISHVAPAREGINVPIPSTTRSPRKKVTPAPATRHYQSNSWRQRPDPTRALSFSSGVLAPSAGLDPALKDHADLLSAQGRPSVHGFLQLRVPPDEALEQELARLGVKLLGPHDDHHKARLPVGRLAAIAALPDVVWVGASPPEQKLSLELAELRGPRAKADGIVRTTPIPIVVNLFEGDEGGTFRRELEAAGAALGTYDPALLSYRAVATLPAIEMIAALDFVLFVELIGLTSTGHDQSTPLIDGDVIRPGLPFGHTRFSGASTIVGVLDTGFMLGSAATLMHSDLDKLGCGQNFTTDAAGPFNDENGHGTHVLGTIAGTGAAGPRFRGMATGVGSTEQIRAAKVWDRKGNGLDPWIESAMDFMSQFGACASAPPEVINISGGGAGFGQRGTDSMSRKLDDKVWTHGQAYVVCGGNTGPGGETIWRPGVAKNALTVGNVHDNKYLQVGDRKDSSSRGPTGDGRMKPNLVAPGTTVTSAMAGTTALYTDISGCSMATPHVTGLAATLMEHYPEFKGRPAFLRSHLMAAAIAHDDVTGKSNDYGLGRVSGYLAHWAHPNSDGWSTHWFYGGVNAFGFAYGDVTVPAGTERLVVVLTWDEPAASAGASRAVTYDLNLWADHSGDCSEPTGACGEYVSQSDVDNVEYLVIDNPMAGTYRLKVQPASAPIFGLRYGMTAVIIRGDPTPAMAASLAAPATPRVGSTFDVTVNVSTPAYVASGVQVELTEMPQGVTLVGLQTMRLDGTTMAFAVAPDTLTLGNVVPMLSRSATWTFRADTIGPKAFAVRAWSENGGEILAAKSLKVEPTLPDLLVTAVTTNPPTPSGAPGSSFSVTSTVQNLGEGPSASSKTRFYLSLDAARSADDTLLTGSRGVPGLAVGSTASGTVNVTVPAATPLDTYYLLACADASNTVAETSEGNNCLASPGAIATVGQPDLVESTISPPPATTARGTTFTIVDTVQNLGAVAARPSTTRHYLSLDAVKSAGDILLTGSRKIPGLAGGAMHAGSMKVGVPGATPLATYFLLVCADTANAVEETDESNNCRASGTTVTVTP